MFGKVGIVIGCKPINCRSDLPLQQYPTGQLPTAAPIEVCGDTTVIAAIGGGQVAFLIRGAIVTVGFECEPGFTANGGREIALLKIDLADGRRDEILIFAVAQGLEVGQRRVQQAVPGGSRQGDFGAQAVKVGQAVIRDIGVIRNRLEVKLQLEIPWQLKQARRKKIPAVFASLQVIAGIGPFELYSAMPKGLAITGLQGSGAAGKIGRQGQISAVAQREEIRNFDPGPEVRGGPG